MGFDKDKQYIEAIKLAVGGVQYKDLSVKETFFYVIQLLYRYYSHTKDDKYLEVSLLYIQAYLEMGFDYEQGSELFDKVLREMGIDKELKFPRKIYHAKVIKLNKSQVRKMIKKWPASPQQTMKIGEVVEDIIEKVSNQNKGIFYYQCAVTGDMYELVINEKESFFHDLRRGLFYSFLI